MGYEALSLRLEVVWRVSEHQSKKQSEQCMTWETEWRQKFEMFRHVRKVRRTTAGWYPDSVCSWGCILTSAWTWTNDLFEKGEVHCQLNSYYLDWVRMKGGPVRWIGQTLSYSLPSTCWYQLRRKERHDMKRWALWSIHSHQWVDWPGLWEVVGWSYLCQLPSPLVPSDQMWRSWGQPWVPYQPFRWSLRPGPSCRSVSFEHSVCECSGS